MAYNITANDGTSGQIPEAREVSQRFQVRSPRDNKFYLLYNTGLAEAQGTFSVAILIENLLSNTASSGEVQIDPADYAANDIIKCEINGAKFEWNKANSQTALYNYCSAGLIKAELDRADQKIFWNLERPLDILVQAGASGTPTTQAVYDFVTQLVGASGIEYKGSRNESTLPAQSGAHGDLYVIADFDVSYPGENIIGLAVYNSAGIGGWDKVPIRWLQPDGVTIFVNPLGQIAVKPGSVSKPLVSADILQDLTLAETAAQPADLAALVTLHTGQTITGKKILTVEPEIPSKTDPPDSTHTTSPATEAQVAQKQNNLSGTGLVEYTPVAGVVTERGITDATAPRTLDGSSENAVTERAVKAALPQINDSVQYNSADKIYAPTAKSNAGNYLGGQMQWIQPDTAPTQGSNNLITSGGVYDSIRTWDTLEGKPFNALDPAGFSIDLAGTLKNEISNKAKKLDHTVSLVLTGDVTGTGTGDLSAHAMSIASELVDAGTPGTYGETADRTIVPGDAFKVLQVTTDAKGRITDVNPRNIKVINNKIGNINVYTGNLYHNQYVNTGIKVVTNESFSFELHGESIYLNFHSRWGETVPLSWMGNVNPQDTFSFSEDIDGFLWLNWKNKPLFSGRELLLVFGRAEKDIFVTDAEPGTLTRPWLDYDNSHYIGFGGGGGGSGGSGGIDSVIHDDTLTGAGIVGNPLGVATINWR